MRERWDGGVPYNPISFLSDYVPVPPTPILTSSMWQISFVPESEVAQACLPCQPVHLGPGNRKAGKGCKFWRNVPGVLAQISDFFFLFLPLLSLQQGFEMLLLLGWWKISQPRWPSNIKCTYPQSHSLFFGMCFMSTQSNVVSLASCANGATSDSIQ